MIGRRKRDVTTFAYDGLNRVTMETNELADVRSFYYGVAGMLAGAAASVVGPADGQGRPSCMGDGQERPSYIRHPRPAPPEPPLRRKPTLPASQSNRARAARAAPRPGIPELLN